MRKQITKFIHVIVFLIALIGVSKSAISQPESNHLYDIQHITVEDGLPDRLVVKVIQDNDGFIWMNPLGYLTRYDGLQFKSYKNTLFKIEEEQYVDFNIDQNNLFWCRALKDQPSNISIFAPQSEKITPFDEYFKGIAPFNSSDIILFHKQEYEGKVYFLIYLNDGQLYNYDGKTFKKITTLIPPKKNEWRTPIFFKNHIWVINHFSVLKYSQKGKLLKQWSLEKNRHSYPKIFDNELYIFSQGLDKSYKVFSIKNDSLSIDYNSNLSTIPPASNSINSLNLDLFSLVWKDGKIVALNKQYEKIFEVKLESKTGILNASKINSFAFDNQDNIWISSAEGIYKISKNTNLFKQYINGNSTRGIYNIGDTTWVASYNNDVCINLKTEQISKGFLKTKNIISINPNLDSSKLLVCQSSRFVNIFDIKTRQNKTFEYASINALFHAIETQKRRLILITTAKGLATIDDDKQKIVPFITDNSTFNNTQINRLYQNNQGIWAASSKGIFLLDETGHIIKHFYKKGNILGGNFLYIHEDKQGIFWLGSKNNGLIKWDQEKETIDVYDRTNGLYNENIYAVIEDKHGYLWLPSDYGLIRFHKKTAITNTYLLRDGLSHVEFNSYSYFQNKETNDILLGGLNGIIQFNPSDFLQDTISNAPINITSYKVLKSGEKDLKDLTSALYKEPKITIRPNDNFFELRFALMDFIDSKQNKYAYQIEGYDKDWNYIEENSIRITSLPYGSYTLKIKGQGDKGQWSNNILSIPLFSKPPFYWTWWFISICVILLISSIIYWLKWRTFALQKDRERLELEVSRRTAIIQEQTKELKALDKIKTQFFSNITHEFRTPLTLIIGPVEQMLKKTNSDWMKQQLKLVQRNTQQLFGLINQLLDVSKLESGKMNLILSGGDLNLFLQEIVETFKPLAESKNISLSYQSDFEEFLTDFDQDKIQKVINNLLSNALKYTSKNGSISLKVIEKAAEGIQIIIADNGQGITAKQQKMIFERFYQVDASSTRQAEGTGIGLALVKELIDLMNGQISVKSELDVGSTFKITLPLFSKTEVSLNEKNNIKSKTTTSSNSLVILIIEDNSDMRSYIKSCLSHSRYQIFEAENGQKGLKIAFEEIPDLIISDVMMPIKNGFEVVQDIRANIKTSHIPVILLTAKTAIKNKIKGFQMGADAYLYKPFNSTELNARINNLIELRQDLQTKYQTNSTASTNLLEQKSTNPNTQKEDKFIAKLRNLILDELENIELNGEYLGHKIGMSRMQLHRKLKALTNQSVGELIKDIRLTKAMELLQSSNLNVSEVAYQTGFSSPSQLSRNFKSRFGFPPSKVNKTQ